MFDFYQESNVSLYVSRVKYLLGEIKQQKLKKKDSGILLLFSSFESSSELFRQESSFFYLTGIREPGVVLVVDLDETSTLYIPNCSQDRTQWMHTPVPLTQENSGMIGVKKVEFLGQKCFGYQFHPFFYQSEYENLLNKIQKVIKDGGKIFTLNPDNSHEYVQQRLILERLKNFISGFQDHIVDVSKIVARMRRKKDMEEFRYVYEAVYTTITAHSAASKAIAPEVSEREVQGALEYVFTASGARAAFPSIVASGKNSTLLHYTDNNSFLKNGDLILIDIGAEIGHYCGDLTRTYPVSGKFSSRQRELYEIVLGAQNYITEIVEPGMWLNNEDKKSKSLHHLTKKFFESKGLGNYFIHGIGHFLGLDVHDVGDYSRPLQNGDLFTIEPGLYIAEESIGIRIEDNFFMSKDKVMCLSDELPKEVNSIEKMMQEDSVL